MRGVRDPERLGRGMVIAGATTFLLAWIALAVALFKWAGG